MVIPIPKAAILGFSFILLLASGYWNSHLGKPYPALSFNIHKLIGLFTLVFLIAANVNAHKAAPLNARAHAAMVTMFFFFVMTIVSGGLLSISKEMPKVIGIIHQVFPYLTIGASGILLYLIKL
jgi:hypothetical protein